MHNPVIILLAAGFSRRYRQATGRHKLLETVDGTGLTVFQHSLGNALKSGLPVVVVVRPESLELQAFCQQANIPFVSVNSQCQGDSICAGVEATREANGWLITLADLPGIMLPVYRAIASAVQEGRCARPFYLGQPGHPVGFPAPVIEDLLALQGKEGARELLRACPPQRTDCTEPGCVRDIDVPADLKAWRR
ncbi:hypothetical protein CWS43_08960 [Rahnella sp. AA]|uniref:nucleotidyltransferase family protein n=1 Tax=Rahnella sp. AA TaxID=2057180 RepID=UPI000C33BE58|nr:nucleotidyltransferase family protein [Rahnella sp. AA]PKE30808.1 hypothetical protein CWS43_08960 [Rahnella sp. AA]